MKFDLQQIDESCYDSFDLKGLNDYQQPIDRSLSFIIQ